MMVMAMVSFLKLWKTCFVTFLILSCVVFVVSAAEGEMTPQEATAAIAQAEEALTVAYHSVLEAEKAGANVSSLLIKLNNAANLILDASIFHKKRDFAGAVQNATLSSQLSEQVKVEAPYLRELALLNNAWRFGWTLWGSIIGAVVVVTCSFLGWRVFRKRYLRKMLKMKPEVSVNEL